MLTSLRIQNFKSWRDTGKLRLAPLTIIFGANSAGKSSLGHLLLALKQTALSSDRKRALVLGDATTLVDLGTFKDCIHGHELDRALNFNLSWKVDPEISIRNWSGKIEYFRGNGLELQVSLKADPRTELPHTTSLKYILSRDDTPVWDVMLSSDPRGKYDLKSGQYNFLKAPGRQWPIGEPEKFYRIPETSMARFRNAYFLADFSLATEAMLKGISFLGPLRDYPQRIYQWSGDTPEDVGQKGQFTIAAILAAENEQRALNRGPRQKKQHFAEFVAGWLKDTGIIEKFTVRPVAVGRKEFEVLIQTAPGTPEVKITDTGFGVSQVLPALVQAFYCPPGSTVWMEQPEIHLHPQIQAELADVFISAIHARENGKPRNVQLIIESHSEHFLTRLQRRIAEEKISPDDVAIYFAKRGAGATELEPLQVNLYGEIENWPENFFGDEMADLAGRTIAAAQRRERETAV